MRDRDESCSKENFKNKRIKNEASKNSFLNDNELKIEDINSKLEELKNNIEINKDLNYSDLQEKYINQIYKSYKIVSSNNNQENIGNNDLIKSYFENKLIEENYVKNFMNNDIEKLKKSFKYKKYIIKEEDKSNEFKEIFNHTHCAF